MNVMEVAAGIIWRKGRFLAARRPPGKPMEGYWEFPGGKQEKDESPMDALRRELNEELGVDAHEITFWRDELYDYTERAVRVRLHFFHVAAFTGQPRSLEGQELRWVTPAEARTMDFLPADKDVLARLPAEGPESVD